MFRQKMKPLWERAAKQINERESRVRAETQVIHGEEFDVWRWIQPRSTASPSPNRKKKVEKKEEIFTFRFDEKFHVSRNRQHCFKSKVPFLCRRLTV